MGIGNNFSPIMGRGELSMGDGKYAPCPQSIPLSFLGVNHKAIKKRKPHAKCY